MKPAHSSMSAMGTVQAAPALLSADINNDNDRRLSSGPRYQQHKPAGWNHRFAETKTLKGLLLRAQAYPTLQTGNAWYVVSAY